MKHQKISKESFFKDFQEMVARKTAEPTKSILQGLEPVIKQRYISYWEHRQKPEELPANEHAHARTVDQRTALESAYNPSSAIIEAWKTKLFKGKVARCAYCQIEKGTHWDHFLPESKFPDYSVYQPNLVRTCDECNTRKSANKTYPDREIVHPYFDPLDSVVFLHCTISCEPALSAVFSIEPDTSQPGYTRYHHTIVSEHFNFFDLANIFQGEASAALGEFSDTLRNAVIDSENLQIKSFIERTSRTRIQKEQENGKNENCWEIALWEAVLTSSEDLDAFWRSRFIAEGILT
ncbi:MAG: hypothetical protein VX620_12190 [Pseudomonadota bacterium]|nr:hypothetical protein [Pseudomonadota bacterium]